MRTVLIMAAIVTAMVVYPAVVEAGSTRISVGGSVTLDTKHGSVTIDYDSSNYGYGGYRGRSPYSGAPEPTYGYGSRRRSAGYTSARRTGRSPYSGAPEPVYR